MKLKFLNFVLFVVISLQLVSSAPDKIVCYDGTWSTYRWGNGKFAVEDIDPFLCTHIIYAFVGINQDGSVRLLDPYLDIDTNNFRRFNALKQQNPNLKTILAIGGWNEGSATYSNVAADPQKRRNLITSALNMIKTYGFDGFDLDWEYPGQRGGGSADKQNYVTLLKEFRTEWDKEGLLLSAAVAAVADSVDISYDVPALSTYFDLINIMAYDLHGPWDGVTGQNAPLYASSLDTTWYQKLLNIESVVNGWIQRGANPSKLILGLPLYGKSFTLADVNNRQLGAPVSAAGTPGKFTQEAGKLGYNEICELQMEGGWTTVWDDQQKVPYMYKGNQWVSFDNVQSIQMKTDFGKAKGLGGFMVWTIDTDDFKGICGVRYPLLSAIKAAVSGTSTTTTSTSSPSSTTSSTTASTSATSTTTTTTSTPPDNGSLCKESGYVRDPIDCSIFYYCMPDGNGVLTPLKYNCPAGLYYDTKAQVCNYPSLVQC